MSTSTPWRTAGAPAVSGLIERGRELFKAKFTTADGAGRPKATQAIIPTKRKFGVNPAFSRLSGPDSNSCSGCHNDPVLGGSGDVVANVFVSEGFESAEFDTTDPSFSSERHTMALMGAGLVELLAREMTADLQAERDAAVAKARASGQDVEVDLVTKGVRFGSLKAHANGIVDLDSLGRRRRRSHRQAVQPQGRVHVAAPVHHQRSQRPSRHGGLRTLRRALDGKPRFRRKRRARRREARATSPRSSRSRRRCRRRPSRATCRRTGAQRRPRGRSALANSAAPPAIAPPCPSNP